MFRSAKARRPERLTGANTPTSQRLRTDTGEAGGAAPGEPGLERGEVAAARRLLRHLAERGERSGLEHEPPLGQGLGVGAERQPRVPLGRLERAEIDEASEGLGGEHTGELLSLLRE